MALLQYMVNTMHVFITMHDCITMHVIFTMHDFIIILLIQGFISLYAFITMHGLIENTWLYYNACHYNNAWLNYNALLYYTVNIQSLRTDRSGQTVKTQIRLLLEEQSDQGLHCLVFHLHFFDKISNGLVSLFEF